MSETKIRRLIRKKPVMVNKHFINPLALMKKLPTDINILINSFLYDENGNNEKLVEYFNSIILNNEIFMKKMNSIYLKEIKRGLDYDDGMNEYEYHIRRKLCKIYFNFASNIIVEFEDMEDGKPTGTIRIKGENNDFIGELVDEEDLIDKYETRDMIQNSNILENINANILFDYFKRGISYYNKNCVLDVKQIKELQTITNTCAYEVLKCYIKLAGGDSHFYEWFVSYHTKEAYSCYYKQNNYENYDETYNIIKINLGWKTTWLVLS